MDNLCTKCGNPLRIISGGMQSPLDTTDIVMVHVHGCLNNKCEKKMQEIKRNESLQQSFENEIHSVLIKKDLYDKSVLLDKTEYERLKKLDK